MAGTSADSGKRIRPSLAEQFAPLPSVSVREMNVGSATPTVSLRKFESLNIPMLGSALLTILADARTDSLRCIFPHQGRGVSQVDQERTWLFLDVAGSPESVVTDFLVIANSSSLALCRRYIRFKGIDGFMWSADR